MIFSEIVKEHQQMVYNACLRILKNPVDAQDATQAVFIILSRKMNSIHNSAGISGWLYRVALNVSKNMIKSNIARRKREEEATNMSYEIHTQVEENRKEIFMCLDGAIASLPEKMRTAVVLHYFEGHTHREIGEMLGCPESTISSRIIFALERLKSGLNKLGFGVSTAILIQHLDTMSLETVPASVSASLSALAAKGTTNLIATKVAGLTMKSMLMAKLKLAAVIASTVIVASTGVYVADMKLGEDKTDKREEKVSAISNTPSESESPYGKELTISKSLGIGGTMDVAIEGQYAYIIGWDKLYVADISSPGNPVLKGELSGLGDTRQIAVNNGIAYIASREYGAFIVDLSNPEKPALLCHYHTIEFATGIAVSGNLLFIACRIYGVEIIDVSNPREPIHSSTVRTGEAQSVDVCNGYLYTGVWYQSEIVTTDIKNPREPKITSRVKLDGFGDGVYVRGKYLYASTGHHSKDTPRDKEGDPGYGKGHGLEIFDISNPAQPVFVSRVKFPSLYYSWADMWSVVVTGNYAFCADTWNGIFVVNIEDIQKPHIVAYKQLAYDKELKVHSYVGGLAVVDDYIYVAGGRTDLYVVSAEGIAKRGDRTPDVPVKIPPEESNDNKNCRIYKPNGQIYAVDFIGDTAFVAAGMKGLRTVQLWPEIKELAVYPTDGFALDITTNGNFVYVAEDKGGLSVWENQGDGKLIKKGKYISPESWKAIKQVFVPRDGKYALLQAGAYYLEFVNIQNPEKPVRVFQFNGENGGYVCNTIGHGLVNNRYASACWHAKGLFWFDLDASPVPIYTGNMLSGAVNPPSNVVSTEDKFLITSWEGGYRLAGMGDKSFKDLKLIKYAQGNGCIDGRPRIYDKKLFLSNICNGQINIVDITDINNPVFLKKIETKGNPGGIVVHNNSLIIPNGYEGLFIYDNYLESK